MFHVLYPIGRPLCFCLNFRHYIMCHNPSFGLVTKVRACKGVCQKWSPGVTFHAPGSVKKCEEWTHTFPSGLPLWELESWWILKSLKGNCRGSKLIELKSSLYHWKVLETWMFKMGLHDPFEYLKHKLWPKKGPGVKLPISLPTTKSRESFWFPYTQVACRISWKALDEGYNWFITLWGKKGKIVTLVESFPMVCGMPLACKEIKAIPNFKWSRVKLAIWLPSLLLAITYILSIQMDHASPF
jgi:hypothetical protein